jgi:hypothetical protein
VYAASKKLIDSLYISLSGLYKDDHLKLLQFRIVVDEQSMNSLS